MKLRPILVHQVHRWSLRRRSQRCYISQGLGALILQMLTTASFAQEVATPKLPDLYVFHYQPSRRDPFISSDARRTLVNGESELHGIASGSVVQQYLQTITDEIKRELFVGGLSVGDGESHSMAIINGVVFSQGDKIPVPIRSQQLAQLEALARTYGLPLEKNQTNDILVEVGTIKSNGVSIALPGFKAALCDLPYEGDKPSQPIQLERKHPSSQP
jgi:hypothetical protein